MPRVSSTATRASTASRSGMKRYSPEASKALAVFVCICNGLTERRILAAVAAGARSHEEVYAACDCTAQCYSCAPEIDAIVELATTAPEYRPSPSADSSPGRSI